MPDGNITAIIQGRKRFELKEIIKLMRLSQIQQMKNLMP